MVTETEMNLAIHKYKNDLPTQIKAVRYCITQDETLCLSKTFHNFLQQHKNDIITPTDEIEKAFHAPIEEIT